LPELPAPIARIKEISLKPDAGGVAEMRTAYEGSDVTLGR
jgi:hypothetical protein